MIRHGVEDIKTAQKSSKAKCEDLYYCSETLGDECKFPDYYFDFEERKLKYSDVYCYDGQAWTKNGCTGTGDADKEIDDEKKKQEEEKKRIEDE